MEQSPINDTRPPARRRKRKIGRYILLLAVLAGFGYAAFWYLTRTCSTPNGRGGCTPAVTVAKITATSVSAPQNTRIKVEVINATTIRGLGRRATIFLRDRGFDVVSIGTSRESRDSTLVLDRSNHPEWSLLVARAFNARSESRPDSSRYVDVTVLLGANWRPPAQPFYP